MKYQSEMLGTWKRLRDKQRELEKMKAESSKGIEWTRVLGKEVIDIARVDRLKVLDKVGSTKEVIDLSAWKDFEIDKFEFVKSDIVVWFVLVVVTLIGVIGG
jgi:hypothetical protein